MVPIVFRPGNHSKATYGILRIAKSTGFLDHDTIATIPNLG
ncbi:MAG: hypothetical protein ACO3GX_12910 [Gemmataceae bacterium]